MAKTCPTCSRPTNKNDEAIIQARIATRPMAVPGMVRRIAELEAEVKRARKDLSVAIAYSESQLRAAEGTIEAMKAEGCAAAGVLENIFNGVTADGVPSNPTLKRVADEASKALVNVPRCDHLGSIAALASWMRDALDEDGDGTMIEWVDDTYKGHQTCCGRHDGDDAHDRDCPAEMGRHILADIPAASVAILAELEEAKESSTFWYNARMRAGTLHGNAVRWALAADTQRQSAAEREQGLREALDTIDLVTKARNVGERMVILKELGLLDIHDYDDYSIEVVVQVLARAALAQEGEERQ